MKSIENDSMYISQFVVGTESNLETRGKGGSVDAEVSYVVQYIHFFNFHLGY